MRHLPRPHQRLRLDRRLGQALLTTHPPYRAHKRRARSLLRARPHAPTQTTPPPPLGEPRRGSTVDALTAMRYRAAERVVSLVVEQLVQCRGIRAPGRL